MPRRKQRFWRSVGELLRLPELVSTILEHIKGILVAATLVLLAVVILYLVVRRDAPKLENPITVPTPRESTTPTPEEDSTVTVSETEGRDAHGKTASLRILVFSRDFAWIYRNDSAVEYQGTLEDFGPHLRSPGLQQNFRNALALIAVGAASQEGGLVSEEDLARRRAARLQRWIKENVGGDQRLHTLSMGQFVGATIPAGDPAKTAPQRRVVIVAVIAAQPGLNLEEALKSALADESAFPFRLQDYSAFELSDWR